MKRTLSQLADQSFDILVIGGGIHGAALLREASTRGYKTALIEQGDFGQATSANSLKIIHGGLRYLQQGDIRRMRQSIRARRIFLESAPHLVHPQPFLLPLYGHGPRGREAMTAGLLLNDWISWDRNHNLPAESQIPPGRVLTVRECLDLFPNLETKGLTGGAVWYDALAVNTERLILEFILDAEGKGAVSANYVEALSLVFDKNDSILGVEAQDRITQDRFRIHSRWVINAAGPWINTLLRDGRQAAPWPIRWTRGLNLVLKRVLPSGYGLGVGNSPSANKGQGKNRRLFFLVPWKGCTMVGTAYQRYSGEPGNPQIRVEDIQEFLNQINAVWPWENLTLKDVSTFHYGLLPLSENQDPTDPAAEPDRHFEIFDHRSEKKIKGLISIKSTKYTTAPVVVEKVMDLIGPNREKAKSLQQTTGGAGVSSKLSSLKNDLSALRKWNSSEELERTACYLYENYGTRACSIVDLIRGDVNLGNPIFSRSAILVAEIIHGIREEMALKLTDIVFRRTDMGQIRRPSRENLRDCAKIMGRELGWDEDRRAKEIEAVLADYGPLNEIDPLSDLR
jgi:glycerol-3-phosphate dehydrogenase